MILNLLENFAQKKFSMTERKAKQKKRSLISAFLPSSFKMTRQGRHQMLKEEMV